MGREYMIVHSLAATLVLPILVRTATRWCAKSPGGGITPTLEVTESDECVLAAEFYSYSRAKVAHALLKSAGTPSFLKGGITAIQLMLPPSFLAQAHELLDSQISEEDLIAQAEAAALSPESAAGEDADDDSLGKKR